MKILYISDFYVGFRLLNTFEKNMVIAAIELFRENPYDESLNNHALRKPLAGRRSISVDDNLRIIFQEKGDYIEVLMLDVGNHTRVYGIETNI